jgi:hypothetical protein
LKVDYLARRHATEVWLAEAASEALGRAIGRRPVYFFLGDFSYMVDASRSAALVIPLSELPGDAITFTLGDSMSVAEGSGRRVYTLPELVRLFEDDKRVAGFGFCDREGFQKRFIEVQMWERLWLPVGRAD